MDAGDFVKFTHTTAYAAALLFVAERELGSAAPPTLDARGAVRARLARQGVERDRRDAAAAGRHRLGQREGHVQRRPRRLAAAGGRRRPHGRAQPLPAQPARPSAPTRPATPLPPNLAGRVSRRRSPSPPSSTPRRSPPARGRSSRPPRRIYARRQDRPTSRTSSTALPHAFYPESSWRDDLELGRRRAGARRAGRSATRARRPGATGERWARLRRQSPASDTLNLYDVSALAHAELVARCGGGRRRGALLADLRAPADARRPHSRAATRSAPPSRTTTSTPRRTRSGSRPTAALYRRAHRRPATTPSATAQRDWALGANAWGASLMIGVGSRFPRCPQHVVANLNGTATRHPRRRRGQRPQRRIAVRGRPRRVLRRGPHVPARPRPLRRVQRPRQPLRRRRALVADRRAGDRLHRRRRAGVRAQRRAAASALARAASAARRGSPGRSRRPGCAGTARAPRRPRTRRRSPCRAPARCRRPRG